MKANIRKTCLCTLVLGLCGTVYAAGTETDSAATSNVRPSVDTGEANGRVSGQGSAGGMQPSTPGGGAGGSAGTARATGQGSSGGRQPVTPGGADQGSAGGKAKPARE
jgi:hypothetical protein